MKFTVALVALWAFCCGHGFAAEPAPRPNIIFILDDDLGWSDTTLYGTTKFYQTPNLERLVKRGMLFTRAYSASPLCSPTRASLLTATPSQIHGSRRRKKRWLSIVGPSAVARTSLVMTMPLVTGIQTADGARFEADCTVAVAAQAGHCRMI